MKLLLSALVLISVLQLAVFEARVITSDFCFSKTIRVEKTGIDPYGRTLAFI